MRVLITGITGTLGQELLRIAEADDRVTEIVGISRDEQKQRSVSGSKLKLRLTDIRDADAVIRATVGIDIVFHCAALKCVDTLEENPLESIKTNILGTQNVIDACKVRNVRSLVMASTDKAVYPINIYGVTKAAAERLVLKSGYAVCRYGNVLGSRGSVVPTFVKAIQEGNPIPITSENMSRYWIRIEDAARFIYDTGVSKKFGLHIPTMKAAYIIPIAKAVAAVMKKPMPAIRIIGMRSGEKLHECLKSSYEGWVESRSSDADHYGDVELRELVRPVVERLL